ncbi:MAG: hypothetical protein WCR69_06775 [Sulfuricurvum sp.]
MLDINSGRSFKTRVLFSRCAKMAKIRYTRGIIISFSPLLRLDPSQSRDIKIKYVEIVFISKYLIARSSAGA